MKYTCSTCGKVFVDNSMQSELIFSRRYWWHRPCAKVFAYRDGKEYVDFPSSGQLCRNTLLEENGDSERKENPVSEMLWLEERVPTLSINPDMATREDIARLAADLIEVNRQIVKLREIIMKAGYVVGEASPKYAALYEEICQILPEKENASEY